MWFGSYQLRWKVAIKKIKKKDTKSTASSGVNVTKPATKKKKSVLNVDEVRFLIRTRHERLVLFLGAGRMGDGQVFLLYEFMDGGSLDTKLWSRGRSEKGDDGLSKWIQRMQVLLDVADGLDFFT